ADVIGERILLDERPYTVVGVLPPAFAFPDDAVRVWTPLVHAAIDAEQRRSHNLRVIGRLAAGVTLESAQAEMDAIAATLAREHPQYMTGWGVNVVPLHRV